MPYLHSRTDAVSARAQVGGEHDTGGSWGRMAVNPGGHGTPIHATLQMWIAPEGERPPELRTVTLQNGLTLFAPAGPAAAPAGLVADLAELARLREAGSLSDTEFAAAKARLLAQSPPD